MAKKKNKKTKKGRLKVKRNEAKKTKRVFSTSDIIIFVLGGIAAVAVAVWGGYYMAKQTGDKGLVPEVRSIVGRVEALRKRKEYDEADRVLSLGLKNYPDDQSLHLQKVYLLTESKEADKALQYCHTNLKEPVKLRQGLMKIRALYRELGRPQEAGQITHELAQLDLKEKSPQKKE